MTGYPPPVTRKALLLGLTLVAAVIAAYLPALTAGFIWNDDTYLTDNPTLDAPGALNLIWTEPKASEQYYPMVFTSFWVEKHLWGLRPFGYHLVNVLLHAASALLLWWLLRRLSLPGAWFAAALFALHPVCVESVAWVTERKNTLSLFLSLLAVHGYLAYASAREAEKAEKTKKTKPSPKKRRRPQATTAWYLRPSALYSFGFAAFTLALFAKTTASLVPAVLLVLVWWRTGRVQPRDARPLVPFFAIGTALAFHTAWLERTMVQASGKEWALGRFGRVVLAGETVAFYAGKLLYPVDLAFVYPRWVIDPKVVSQWLPAAAALAAVGAAWVLRQRVGRGPLAALLLYGGVLFPAMGFFNVYAMRYSYVADHFAYQAVVVGTSAVACGVASAVSGTSVLAHRAAAALGVGVLVVLGVLTYRQTPVYRNEETVWRDTLAKSPSSFMAHTNLGLLLVNSGRAAEGVQHFERSLALKPDNVQALLNLARVDEQAGRFDDAAARLREAHRIDPADTVVLINLGTALTKAGRFEEAIATYRDELRLGSPDDYLAHNGLGAALLQSGRLAEAIDHFRETVRLRPDYEHGRANLERALAIAGGAR